jgi:hypothetical protein
MKSGTQLAEGSSILDILQALVYWSDLDQSAVRFIAADQNNKLFSSRKGQWHETVYEEQVRIENDA